jgi:hypothetical protein
MKNSNAYKRLFAILNKAAKDKEKTPETDKCARFAKIKDPAGYKLFTLNSKILYNDRKYIRKPCAPLKPLAFKKETSELWDDNYQGRVTEIQKGEDFSCAIAGPLLN